MPGVAIDAWNAAVRAVPAGPDASEALEEALMEVERQRLRADEAEAIAADPIAAMDHQAEAWQVQVAAERAHGDMLAKVLANAACDLRDHGHGDAATYYEGFLTTAALPAPEAEGSAPAV